MSASPAIGPAREAGGFALVGAAGFLVDAGLTAALAWAGAGPVAARLPAILAALCVTFMLNRRFVFAAGDDGALRQFGRYLLVSAGGAGINLLVYLVAAWMLAAAGAPAGLAALLAVGAGSGAAMAVNYLGYRGFAFAAPGR